MHRHFFSTEICTQKYMKYLKERRGRDRMVVAFTTIFTISAYHH